MADSLLAYTKKRDFRKTAEPAARIAAARRTRRFVIQKHDATRLHFDFRLEFDGVLKSWAIPKGPSCIPGLRRLAVQVEDHPVDYASFEGTIAPGQYGGGTVMLWDVGTYEYAGDVPDADDGIRRGLVDGKLSVALDGVRLQGRWTLVRTKDDETQWLCIRGSGAGSPVTSEATAFHLTSVATDRTMEEIAADES